MDVREVQKKFLTSGILPYSGDRISLSFPWQRANYLTGLLMSLESTQVGHKSSSKEKRKVILAITHSVALGNWLYY